MRFYGVKTISCILALLLLIFASPAMAGGIPVAGNSFKIRLSWTYEFADDASRVEIEKPKLLAAASAGRAKLFIKPEPSEYGERLRVTVKGDGTIKELRKFLLSPTSQGTKILISRPTILSFEGTAPKRKTVTLILRSNITTGYSWQVDEETLSFFEDYEAKPYVQKEPLIGGEGERRFVFRTSTPGSKRILLKYRRPWEDPGKGVAILTVKSYGEIPELIPLAMDTSPDTGHFRTLASREKPPFESGGSEASYRIEAYQPSLGQSLPSHYDLRSQLTGVKDQSSCGSCWAFATVGVLEGLIKIHSGATTDLSEQFLVSCNRDNWSCDGGWFAHDYHKDKIAINQNTPGAVIEADMPYTATNGTCFPVENHPYTISDWRYVSYPDEIPSVDQIKEAIYNHGPVAAAVCAGDAFQNYQGGIFDIDESAVCGGTVNHAIVLVGWDDSQQVWILRNSWGPGWGENGYMRIRWGTSNVGYGANYAEYRNTCTYSVSPTSINVSSNGGTGTISVNTSGPSCSWSAGSNASWIRIDAGSSGIGSGTVTYSVESNPGSARSGTLTVAGQTVTVNQDGSSACTYSVSPSQLSLGSSAGEGTITVTTQSGCSWTASSSVGWLQIVSGSSGSGSGTVLYRVSENTTGSARSTTLLVAGHQIPVEQAAPSGCTYALTSLSNTFDASGGRGTVGVLTQSGCSWTAFSSSSWVTITSGSSGTGNGTVVYQVSPYSGSTLRTATITIADQTFTVRQTGISPAGDRELSNGVPLSQTLSASTRGETWHYYFVNIPSDTTKLTVTLSNLDGDLDLFLRKDGRPTDQLFDCVSGNWERTEEECTVLMPSPGTWWIGINNWDVGNIGYTVRASWSSGCVTDLTPQSSFYTASGGEGSIYVSTLPGCFWNVSSTNASWITITSGSGIGDGVVHFTVAPFSGSGYREGIISVGGLTATVRQSSATDRTNLLENPGFEQGHTAWEELSFYGFDIIYNIGDIGGLPPLEGSYVAWLGGYDDEGAFIRQRVSIPANSDVSFSFSYLIYSEDYCGYDFGGAWILDETGNSILRRITVSDLCWLTDTYGQWQRSPSFDLSDFAGKNVIIEFFAITDSSLPSSLFVDSVELGVSPSSGGGINPQYLTEVQKAYVAYYGRPADPGGQDYWAGRLQEAGGDLSAIIDAFGNSQEFLDRYGYMSNSELIDAVYLQMFGRLPDEAGKAYYLEQLNSGLMTLQTITLNIMNGAQGSDLTVINNRVEVAEYFTQMLRSNPSCRYSTLEDIERAQAILQSVTDDPSTVASAKALVDGYCSP